MQNRIYGILHIMIRCGEDMRNEVPNVFQNFVEILLYN